MDEPIPQAAAFRIQLPTFEGPLDLLLHLIKKHELDVLELPIAFVTERYLEYLGLMQELDLDIASEYLLMAATLAHIKSKSLLPSVPADNLEEQEEGYQEDPRAELIRRLLEYQKYKAAGEQLGGRPLAGRDVFPRGMSAPEAQGPAPLASFDLYKLLDAFQGILKRVSGRAALEVTAERITIHERITELSDLLSVKRSCTFEELFVTARTRYEVVVTFLALLEMTKLRITRIYQADPKAAIHVHYALLDADSPSVPPEDGPQDAAEPAWSPTAVAFEASEPAVLDSAFDSSIDHADDEQDAPDAPAFSETDTLEMAVDAAQLASDLSVQDQGVAVLDEEFALADTEVGDLTALGLAPAPSEVEPASASEPCDEQPSALFVPPDPESQPFDDEETQQYVQHEHDESKP